MSDRHVQGRIEVSPAAVATIANHAVLSSYGVVGMSPKNLVNGLAQILRPDSKRGVEVHIDPVIPPEGYRPVACLLQDHGHLARVPVDPGAGHVW